MGRSGLVEGSRVRMKGGGRISSWNEAGLSGGMLILYGMSSFEGGRESSCASVSPDFSEKRPKLLRKLLLQGSAPQGRESPGNWLELSQNRGLSQASGWEPRLWGRGEKSLLDTCPTSQFGTDVPTGLTCPPLFCSPGPSSTSFEALALEPKGFPQVTKVTPGSPLPSCSPQLFLA